MKDEISWWLGHPNFSKERELLVRCVLFLFDASPFVLIDTDKSMSRCTLPKGKIKIQCRTWIRTRRWIHHCDFKSSFFLKKKKRSSHVKLFINKQLKKKKENQSHGVWRGGEGGRSCCCLELNLETLHSLSLIACTSTLIISKLPFSDRTTTKMLSNWANSFMSRQGHNWATIETRSCPPWHWTRDPWCPRTMCANASSRIGDPPLGISTACTRSSIAADCWP